MNCKTIKHIKSINIAGYTVACFLMWLTVQNVDVRWGQAEVVLQWSLPALSVLAMIINITDRAKAKRCSALDVLVLIWAAYYCLWAYIGTEFPCTTQFLKDFGMFLLYFTLRPIMSCCKSSSTFIISFLLICGCYEALEGLWQVIHGSGRHYLYLLTGSFLNPGPYSAYILLALVVCVTSLEKISVILSQSVSGIRKYAESTCYFITVLLSIVMFSTWSRAAIISFMALSLYVFRQHYWKYRVLLWLALGSCCILLYVIKQGSADGRLLTWAASLTSWLHSPWVGVGIGGFHHACGEGIAELYSKNINNPLFAAGNVAEYAFCDFIKVLVEQGVVGGLLCIACLMVALYNVYHWNKPLFYGLLSLVIFSLFSYPFEQHPFRIILVLLAASAPHRHSFVKVKGILEKTLLSVFCLCVATLSGFVATASQDRFNAYHDVRLFSNMHHEAFIKDYYELLPQESDNPRFLFDFAKTLREAGRFNDSNAMLRQGTLVSSDPMFYVLQGKNYKDMHCYGHAEASYKKALAVMPNRIYPLYQLMLLYKDTDQSIKMKKVASRILQSRPKVTSPATEEIIKKAKECL